MLKRSSICRIAVDCSKTKISGTCIILFVCVGGGGLSCVHYDVSCFLAYFCYAGPMSSLFGVDLFDFREVV